LETTIARYLPEGEFLFPPDQITDKSEQFIAAEVIREKLMHIVGQEVPYALTVTIEQFAYQENILHITALIVVEKPGQKAIVIGSGGENLKKIGKQARLELEERFAAKIFLKLWVKVKTSWSDDERSLKNLGFE
jgi:GTP-binding protein Era